MGDQSFTLVPTRDLMALTRAVEGLREEVRQLQCGPEWMTIEQAAKANRVTASTVRRWVAKQEWESKGAGKALRVRPR